MEAAAAVPVPDAVDERILLHRPAPRVARSLASAATAAVIVFIAGDLAHEPGPARAVHAITAGYPGLEAIAEVAAENRPPPVDALEADGAALDRSLARLGLTLTASKAVRHVGKCHIEGARECEHVVFATEDAHANVMLVPDYPIARRLVVADRSLVALVAPAGTGGYIIVADSPDTARRMEKLLVKRRV